MKNYSILIPASLTTFPHLSISEATKDDYRDVLVDVGDHVKEGQLIATLELPEAQSDLDRASASLRRAEEDIKRAVAGYGEAKVTLDRLMSVEKKRPNLIAPAI